MAASKSAQVTFPARCAASVVCGDHLISQVYPAAIPVEVFIDDVVELLNEELLRRGGSGLHPEMAYELNRVDGTRLDVTKTLDELGVEDGTTLVLVPAHIGDPFEPQYESLSTGLARVGKRIFEPVTQDVAVRIALAILAVVAMTILALAVYARAELDSLLSTLLVGTIGILLSASAAAVYRWRRDRMDILGGLAWPAVPMLAGGVALAPPGDLGAPHIFIAAFALAVLTCGAVAIWHKNLVVIAATVVLSGVVGSIAAVRMWSAVPTQILGMGALAATLVLVSVAPTIALWAARIRPPHFGSITGRDLFRRADGLPIDTVSPVEEDGEDESHRDPTPRGSAITSAARRANSVLTGICIASAIVMPPAVWMTLLPGHPRGNYTVVLAALFVVIFISRGRAFADRWQAIALVCGASVAVCAGVVRYVLCSPAISTLLLLGGAGILVAFALSGLTAALVVPETKFTPLIRMVAEWVELTAIVAAFPLAAWIGGLFTWVRMR